MAQIAGDSTRNGRTYYSPHFRQTMASRPREVIKQKAGRSPRAELRARHSQLAGAIRTRLGEFASVPRSEYFYELAYCLLTPQSSAVNADTAVKVLRDRRFLEHPFDTEDVLRISQHYIRFHRTKAKRLVEAHAMIPKFLDMLDRAESASFKRTWLVEHIKGLGMKEATHFLRNIGCSGGMAILDRHILRNLKRHGVIRSIPGTLTRKRYEAIEQRFQKFSSKIGIPLDDLDLLFWSMETGEIRK